MKSTNYLLFKQIFRNIFREKLQYFLIVFLVIVASALASGLWITNTRLTSEAQQMKVSSTKYDYFSNYLDNGIDVNQLSYFSRAYGEENVTKNTTYLNKSQDSNPEWFASRSNTELSTIDPRLLVNSPSIETKTAGIFVNKNGVTFTGWKAFTLGSFQRNNYFNPSKNLYFFNMSNPDVKNSTYGKLIENYQTTKDISYLNTAWNLFSEIANKIQSSPTSVSSIFAPSFSAFHTLNPAVTCNYTNFFTNWLDKNVAKKQNITSIVYETTNTNKIAKPTRPNAALFGLPILFGKQPSLFYNLTSKQEEKFFHNFNFSFNRNNDTDATKITFNSDDESHLELLIQAAGMGSGFKTQFRRSFTFQDYAAQVLYGFVDIGTKGVTNNNLDTFSVFEGSAPKSKYQVVISPQYARYKGKSVGDQITINKRVLTISGIGGDGYYIYPVINVSSVLPNTRHEVILYGLNSLYNSDDVVTYSLTERTLFDGVYFKHDKRMPNSVLDSNAVLKKLMLLNNVNTAASQLNYANAISNPNSDSSVIKIKKFSSLSPAQQSRTTWFLSLQKIFNLTSAIVTVIIVIIAALAGIAITRFLVNKTSSQFGVLKANGYGPAKLAASYIMLPLAICIVGVPLGWIFGMVLQIPFTEIFNTMFILPHNLFMISGIPLLTVFLGFFALLAVTVVTTALLLLKKDTLALLTSSFKLKISKTILKLQNIIRVKNFTFQFQTSLVATNFRKLLILSGAFFASSLIISLCFLIPGSIENLGTNYYKNLSANMAYDYNGVTGNSPLSRIQLYKWNGLYGKSDSKSAFEKAAYPIGQIFPVSPYIKYHGVLYKFSDIADGKKIPLVAQQQIIDEIVNEFAWSFNNLQAKTISPGFLDAIVKLLPKIGIASDPFQQLICSVLGQVVGKDQVKGTTISQCMSSVIYNYKQIPVVVRQLYNSSKEIQNEFRLTWNSVPFNKNTDELYTWFNSLMLDNNNNPLLNGNKRKEIKTYGVRDDSKFVKLSTAQRKEIGTSWVDLKTVKRTIGGKTENYKVIPILVNNTLEKQEHYKIGQYLNFYPTHNETQWKDNNGIYHPLVKNAWSYDDPDKYNDSTKNIFSWANLNQLINTPYKTLSRTQAMQLYRNTRQEIYHPDLVRFNWNKQLQENGIKKANTDDPNVWWINHFASHNHYCAPGSTATSCTTPNGKRFDSNYLKYTTHPFSESFGRGLLAESGSVAPTLGDKSWAATTDPKITTALNYLTGTSGTTWGSSKHLDGGRRLWNQELLDGTDPNTSKFSQTYLNKLIDGERNYEPDSLEWIKNRCSTALNNPLCSDPYSLGYGGKVIYKVVGVHESYNDPTIYLNQRIANHLVHFSDINSASVYNTENDYKTDPFNGNNIWFNGKFSSENTPSDLTSMFSTSFQGNSILYEIGCFTYQQQMISSNVQLLGIQHAVFNKFSEIALSLITIIVIIVIIASAICVIMITNIFVTQFSKIIAVMKIQGYSRARINWIMLSIFSPGILIAFGLSFYLAWSVFKVVSTRLFTAVGFNVPITFIPWVLPVCIVVILGIYALSFLTGILVQKRMDVLQIASSSET